MSYQVKEWFHWICRGQLADTNLVEENVIVVGPGCICVTSIKMNHSNILKNIRRAQWSLTLTIASLSYR